MSWVEQATELLHSNETIRETIRVGTGGVVVTNQRLLIFTPEQAGANFRQVDRPNVESITQATSGDGKFLAPGLKAGIVGLVMVGFGYAVSFDQLAEGISLDSGGAASAVGIGQMLGMVQTFLGLLAMLDDLLRIFGGLAIAFSAVVLGVYVWSREQRLIVSVAGENDISIAAGGDVDEQLLGRLRAAIQVGGTVPTSDSGGVDEAATGAGSGNDYVLSDIPAPKDDTGPSAAAESNDEPLGNSVDLETDEPAPTDDPTPVGAGKSPVVDEATVENIFDEPDEDSEASTDDDTRDLS